MILFCKLCMVIVLVRNKRIHVIINWHISHPCDFHDFLPVMHKTFSKEHNILPFLSGSVRLRLLA